MITSTKSVLDEKGILATLKTMAAEICEVDDGPWAVVGIRRGGEHLARRLTKLMTEHTGLAPPLGMVDITLYRDDGFGPNDWPEVGVTDIPFELKKYTIVLVDDVLYTGRTVRAALDAILDYGRPRAVRLAVLVDRGLRELPIRGDIVGIKLSTTYKEHVDVVLKETGAKQDAVKIRLRDNAGGDQ